MGLLNRALDEESTARSFIKKALDMRETEDEPNRENLQKKKGEEERGPVPDINIKKLLEEIGTLPQSIELPGMLFSILKNHLGVKKAMFLLPDSRGTDFKPWASCGYDPTTVHRFKFPNDSVRTIAENTDTPVYFLTNSDIKALEPYLSSREFSLMEETVITIFYYNNIILGLYFISDINRFKEYKGNLGVILSVVEELCSPLLWESRHNKMRNTKPAKKTGGPQAAGMVLQGEGTTELHGSIIEFSNIVDEIKRANDHLDDYRLYLDIFDILKKLCGNRYANFILPDRRFLILSQKPYDFAALKLQMENAIKLLFGELANKPDLRWEEFNPAQKNGNIKEAIIELFK
jgi:hypothetical protein